MEKELYPSLHAWLQLGVRLAVLSLKDDHYDLKSLLAKRFAEEKNDDIAALTEEVVTMHHRLIFETPKTDPH